VTKTLQCDFRNRPVGHDCPGSPLQVSVCNESRYLNARLGVDSGERMAQIRGDRLKQNRTERGKSNHDSDEPHRSRNARGHAGALDWNHGHAGLRNLPVQDAGTERRYKRRHDDLRIVEMHDTHRGEQQARCDKQQPQNEQRPSGEPVFEMRRHDARHREALESTAINATQYNLLCAISRLDAPTQSDLSALGYTLKPLVRDGFVESRKDDEDARKRRIALTEAG
jgi:hypothetical protein